MISRLSGHPSVAVLLSGREKFSSHFGGAVARWNYEVYSRLQHCLAVTVFGFPTDPSILYPLPHQTSSAWRACSLLSKIPLARRHEDSLWLRALMPKLKKFDAVHIHNRPQWVFELRNLGHKGLVILHLHNDHLGHWPAHQLDALAVHLDAVVTCSDYLRSTFGAKSALLDQKTHVVFNGVDLKKFYPSEEIRESKTILFAGRFDAEKGILQLLQAYEKIIERHPDAKLVIGGATGFGTHTETDYVQRVRTLALDLQKNKKANIFFTGYLDHDTQLLPWFQRATIFSSPSLFQEPFGLVNVEAMACATTTISSRRGGIPEVLGDTGRLIEPENTTEFANTIIDLLSQPKLCRSLGEAGLERVRRMFDWSFTAKRWNDLLDSLLNSQNSLARSSYEKLAG